MNMIINQLNSLISDNQEKIADWFTHAHQATPPCFYSSVDLRHSGTKLVPVDTNLFPAGFNHLSHAARERAKKNITQFLSAQTTEIQSVLILPESHTRNVGYIDNLYALRSLFTELNLDVTIGSMEADQQELLTLQTSDGHDITRHPTIKDGNNICTMSGFTPDLIIVNNDLSSGSPELLKGVTQLVVPQTGLGWYRRKKSIHFDAYARVSKQFSEDFGIDPWQITALHHKCGLINFRERKGIDCVALGVEKLLRQIRERYNEYGITEEPYVFIKADSGTYGMGIMTVTSGDEVIEMNKKARNKMNIIKEGIQTSEVIIQEGIPTIDMVGEAAGEPMIYCINGYAVGGAYRINHARGAQGNLNASGMEFVGMCDEEKADRNCPKQVSVPHCNFAVYSLISQLATLAAAREEYGEMYWI